MLSLRKIDTPPRDIILTKNIFFFQDATLKHLLPQKPNLITFLLQQPLSHLIGNSFSEKLTLFCWCGVPLTMGGKNILHRVLIKFFVWVFNNTINNLSVMLWLCLDLKVVTDGSFYTVLPHHCILTQIHVYWNETATSHIIQKVVWLILALLPNAEWQAITNFIKSQVFLIVLGFNDTSTLVGHSVSSPREREKRERRDSRGDEREWQGRKRNRNERNRKNKSIPPLPLPATRIAGLTKLEASISWTPRWRKILFVLRFYGPVNPMRSCRAWSVYLTTRLLGRLSPLSG